MIGNWIIYEVKSSYEGKDKIRKLNPPSQFKIINDTLAAFIDEGDGSVIIGKLNTEQKTLIFPSVCCAACFEYKFRNNQLYLENVLGVKSIACKK